MHRLTEIFDFMTLQGFERHGNVFMGKVPAKSVMVINGQEIQQYIPLVIEYFYEGACIDVHPDGSETSAPLYHFMVNKRIILMDKDINDFKDDLKHLI
jgi:hypothetical protein